MSAVPHPASRPFFVEVKDAARVRLILDVMAPNKVAAQERHECLCEDGEQCIALTPQEFHLRASGEVSDQNSEAYHQALVAQVDRNNAQGFTHG